MEPGSSRARVLRVAQQGMEDMNKVQGSSHHPEVAAEGERKSARGERERETKKESFKKSEIKTKQLS